MNIFKKWYFEWLDANKWKIIGESRINLIDLVDSDFPHAAQQVIDNKFNDLHFVNYIAKNPHLLAAIVENINEMQLK